MGFYSILLLLCSITLSIGIFMIFFCLTKQFSDIRSRISMLYKRIPREVVSDIHEKIVKMCDDDNNSGSSVSLSAIPNFCIIGLCLIVILVSSIALFAFFGYSSVSILISDTHARNLIAAAADNMAAVCMCTHYAGEKVIFDPVCFHFFEFFWNFVIFFH